MQETIDAGGQAHTLDINWKLCCICQKSDITGTSKLTCPAKNPIPSKRNTGYTSFARNLEEIRQYNHKLPSGKKVDALDDGSGIESNLIKNTAQWHKACHVKYTGAKFEALKKKLIEEQEAAEQVSSVTSNPVNAEKIHRVTRSKSVSVDQIEKADVCFICKLPAARFKPLICCQSDEVYLRVKEYAERVGDTQILATLVTGGDLVAQDAKYHKACLTKLYSKSRGITSSETSAEDGNRSLTEGLAFADLTLYIKEEMAVHGKNVIFQMGQLKKQYMSRLAQLLGVPETTLPEEQTTRLRKQILTHFPELREHLAGRVYVLMHNTANLLKNTTEDDQDDDALAFQRCIRRLRRILSNPKVSFEGTFSNECEVDSIHPLLLGCVNMLLYGSTVTSDSHSTRPAVSICQSIVLNFREKTPKGNIIRQRRMQEPPLPLYMALSVYGRSRDKFQIDNFHDLGLTVSSNRVMEVTAQLCRMVVARAQEEGVVCPSTLQKRLFTVAALDKIDHKPTSTSSEGEFHGTGISVFQLWRKDQDSPVTRCFQTNFRDVEIPGDRRVPDLPDFYATVPDFILQNKQPPVPVCTSEVGQLVQSVGPVTSQWYQEESWLKTLHDTLSDNPTMRSTVLNVSWAAFHAAKQSSSTLMEPSINALLPLFHEKSSNPAMIKHGMDVVRKITSFLNDSQTPVMCVDQPLYALSKIIQWSWPEVYGDDKFVTLFGPLHIEQTFMQVLGQFLDGSGWVGIAANSGIITAGSAEGILKVKHVTKTRKYHQITAGVLHSLLQDAYELENPSCEVPQNFDDWIDRRASSSATFKFWFLVLNLEVLLLSFVRSLRQGLFDKYRDALRSMVPWFFAFDHHHYARWLSVHVKDLEELQFTVPSVYEQFQQGKFVVQKTRKPFSSLGVDHAHEQNNAVIKQKGGAIGLTQDPSSLRRWTIGGPEVARLLREFENDDSTEVSGLTHHEGYKSFQIKFLEKSSALKDTFLQHENPFTVTAKELFALDSRIVVGEEGRTALYSVEEKGASLYTDFVQKRLVAQTKPFYDPIKKLNTKIFGAKKSTKVNPTQALKLDLQLFSRLFIVATARNLDLETFFEYENQLYPPSLSFNGKLRPGNKADLSTILENLARDTVPQAPGTCDGIVIDGAALVRLDKPRPNLSTFQDYFKSQIKAHLSQMAETYGSKRMDVAWDLYSSKSIKNTVRSARGSGLRRQDLPQKGKLPTNWEDYLRNSENKEDLFRFLADALLKGMDNVDVVTNVSGTWKSSRDDISSLSEKSCVHLEEADGRIITHVKDMALQGLEKVLIRCSDTDVLVLAVSFFPEIARSGLKELWLMFGCGRTRRFIAAHKISDRLGEEKATALRGFHAFTGCDTVSFFGTKGKRSAWQAWDESTTEAFVAISRPSLSLSKDVLKDLERFVVRLYGEKTADSVNKARKILFATENKTISNIPPTSAALEQHSLRAAYQAGQLWGVATQLTEVEVASPQSWGWSLLEDWEPYWTTQPNIWDACRALDRCGCTTKCDTMRCVCRRLSLPCTPACKKCQGNCSNSSSRYMSEELTSNGELHEEDELEGDLD